jgi:hypothetical protein
MPKMINFLVLSKPFFRFIAASVLPVGAGRIVYLVDNPHYRMFWRGASRMLQNAIMMVPNF